MKAFKKALSILMVVAMVLALSVSAFAASQVVTYTGADKTTDAKITLSRATFDRMQSGELKAEQAIASGDVKVEGRKEAVTEFVGLIQKPSFWFNIVTP